MQRWMFPVRGEVTVGHVRGTQSSTGPRSGPRFALPTSADLGGGRFNSRALTTTIEKSPSTELALSASSGTVLVPSSPAFLRSCGHLGLRSVALECGWTEVPRRSPLSTTGPPHNPAKGTLLIGHSGAYPAQHETSVCGMNVVIELA